MYKAASTRKVGSVHIGFFCAFSRGELYSEGATIAHELSIFLKKARAVCSVCLKYAQAPPFFDRGGVSLRLSHCYIGKRQ